MRKVIGVMGSADTLEADAYRRAYDLGGAVASRGWVLLTGGRASGVMDAASKGARDAGGLAVGILPDADTSAGSPYLDIAIRTGMGDARNVINVLSSDVVIALPGGAGTISEVALALKNRKAVVAVGWDPGDSLRACGPGRPHLVATVEDALDIAAAVLDLACEA